MSSKQIFFESEAREKILKGATLLANAVRVTLGPKSKCVLIEKAFGRPIVCNDGVTIAKEITLKCPEENLGASMMREAAERTGDAVGDGTSTATIRWHTAMWVLVITSLTFIVSPFPPHIVGSTHLEHLNLDCRLQGRSHVSFCAVTPVTLARYAYSLRRGEYTILR